MIVDSSALLAVLSRDLDAERYETAILTAPRCRISVGNLLETLIMVESRSGAEARHEPYEFLEFAEIEPTPVTAEHLAAARQVWRQFGKGRHPAALDLGDCFAYVLAHVSGESRCCTKATTSPAQT